MDMDKNKQFILRVKHGTQLDAVLRYAFDNNGNVSDKEIEQVTGLKSYNYSFRWLVGLVDNLNVHLDRKNKVNVLSYTDPTPLPVPAPVSISLQQASTQSQAAVEMLEPKILEPMKWSEMPPTPKGMGDRYIEPSWFNTMAKMVQCGKHIALAGPPGVGKDTGIIELAARYGKPLVTVAGEGGLRKRDLTGSVDLINGSTVFNVAEFATAVVNGWWASITEINMAEPDVVILMNAIMADPYIININGKAYPVHKDFRLFVSYNPGLVGTKPLNQAFKDRFFSIQVPFYTNGTMRKVLKSHGMPDEVWANIIVEYASRMWDAHERGLLRYQITTRRLIDSVLLMNENVCTDVFEALSMSVLAAIDMPAECKAAKMIMNETKETAIAQSWYVK